MVLTSRQENTIWRRLIVLGRRWRVRLVGGCALAVVLAAAILGIPVNGLLLLLAKTAWLVCVVLSLLGEVTKIAELDVELSLSDAPSWLNRSMKVYLWSLKVGGLMVCPLVFAAPLVLVFPDLLSSPVRYVVVGLALIGSIPIMVGLVVALLMIPLVLFVAIPVGIVKARRRRREEALAYLEYLHRRPQ